MNQGTSPDTSRYEIVPLSGTELTVIGELRRQMLGEGSVPLPHDAARAEWLYARNPAGPAEILALRERRAGWVGMTAIVPRQLWIDGTERPGAYLCDFYVHPAHRTLLPALSLQREAKRRLVESGRVTYAIPNEQSLPIFKRLGAQQTLQRYRWARPLRSKALLMRRGVWLASVIAPALDAAGLVFDTAASLLNRGIQARRIEQIDERFDQLWSSLSKRAVCIGDRSARFLRWRFRDEPGHENQILGLVEQATDRLVGYAIGEIAGDQFVIRDVLVTSANHRIARTLSSLLLEIRKLGVAGVSIRTSGPDGLIQALERVGLRSRDSQTVFIGQLPSASSGSWVLTTADEDV